MGMLLERPEYFGEYMEIRPSTRKTSVFRKIGELAANSSQILWIVFFVILTLLANLIG